jgi:spermidine synthase
MKRLGFYGGLSIVAAAGLMLQIVQTRILSVIAWYHLAFFVISIAMFGLTAGAIWVYLRRGRFAENTLSHDLAYFSAALAATTVLAFAAQLTLAPVTELTLVSLLIWAELAICLAAPFFFSGVVVSLALTRSPFPVGRVYAADLAGAAIGCLGVLVLLDTVDGPSAVLWVAALTALAAVLFSYSGIGTTPQTRPPLASVLQRPGWMFLVLIAIAIGNDLAAPRGLRPVFVKGRAERLENRIFEEWNSFSRILVFDTPNRHPHMWGPSRAFRPGDWSIEQRFMNIDGSAGTTAFRIDGAIGNAGFLKYDVTNLAYFLPDRKRAGIIGVGGGRDLLSARVFGVPDITGVEINPIFHRLLTREPGFAEFSGLSKLGGMQIEVDEARSWFARTRGTFDIIQMTLVDTWAATGAGAFSLTENGLYTVEAWHTFLERLSPGGVFTVSRWYAPAAAEETGRMVSLAMAAAFSIGADEPRRHIFLAASGHVATLVLGRTPLSSSAVAALEAAAAKLDYTVLISPNRASESQILQQIVASSNSEELNRYTSDLPLDLTPPTDERPFFFNQLPLYDPWQTIKLVFATNRAGVVSGNLFATATLLILFLISAVLVLGAIILPMRPAIRDVGPKLAFGGTAYFLLLGVGFMSVEIGLLQRMSVFLGHPIYSLSVVLFAIILATGIGSLTSDRLPLDSRARLVSWSALTGGYLLALPLWLPNLLLAFGGSALPARATLCVLVIAPAGLLMGYGFPTGMRLISAVDRTPAPWFWGINGGAGVLAATLAMTSSIALGISVTLTIGGLSYLLLIPAALAIGFKRTLSVGRLASGAAEVP